MGLRALDLYLRGKVYGPLAWWIQRHWGYSKYDLARLCSIASPIMGTVFMTLTASNLLGMVLMNAANAGFWLMGFMRLKIIKQAEMRAREYPQVDEFVTEATWQLRLFTLALFAFADVALLTLDFHDTHGWVWAIIVPCRTYMTMYASGVYFEAVPQPPPFVKKQRAPLFAFLRPVPHAT